MNQLNKCWVFCKFSSFLPIFFFLSLNVNVKSLSRVRLCNPMGCSLPGSSVHGIFQAIVLEWIAISFSKGSSQPRDRTQVSRIVDTHFTIWASVADTVHPCFNGILPQSYFSLFFKHMPAELAFFNWTIFKVFIAFVTVLLLICFDF